MFPCVHAVYYVLPCMHASCCFACMRHVFLLACVMRHVSLHACITFIVCVLVRISVKLDAFCGNHYRHALCICCTVFWSSGMAKDHLLITDAQQWLSHSWGHATARLLAVAIVIAPVTKR